MWIEARAQVLVCRAKLHPGLKAVSNQSGERDILRRVWESWKPVTHMSGESFFHQRTAAGGGGEEVHGDPFILWELGPQLLAVSGKQAAGVRKMESDGSAGVEL